MSDIISITWEWALPWTYVEVENCPTYRVGARDGIPAVTHQGEDPRNHWTSPLVWTGEGYIIQHSFHGRTDVPCKLVFRRDRLKMDLRSARKRVTHYEGQVARYDAEIKKHQEPVPVASVRLGVHQDLNLIYTDPDQHTLYTVIEGERVPVVLENGDPATEQEFRALLEQPAAYSMGFGGFDFKELAYDPVAFEIAGDKPVSVELSLTPAEPDES